MNDELKLNWMDKYTWWKPPEKQMALQATDKVWKGHEQPFVIFINPFSVPVLSTLGQQGSAGAYPSLSRAHPG